MTLATCAASGASASVRITQICSARVSPGRSGFKAQVEDARFQLPQSYLCSYPL